MPSGAVLAPAVQVAARFVGGHAGAAGGGSRAAGVSARGAAPPAQPG